MEGMDKQSAIPPTTSPIHDVNDEGEKAQKDLGSPNCSDTVIPNGCAFYPFL